MANSVQGNSTAGWVAEWVGPVGKRACFNSVTSATVWGSGPVSVVVDYLKKSAMVDLPDFEEVCGKKKVVELLGDNSTQVAVPFEIEKLLQTDLSELFTDPEVLKGYGEKTKLTEISSLFFKIQGLTPYAFIELGVACADVEEGAVPFFEHAERGLEKSNQWIIALDEPLAHDKGPEEQSALVPVGAEIPSYLDKTHTVMASALPNVNLPISSTPTRCKEEGASNLGKFYMTVRYQPPVEEGENGEIDLGYDELDFAVGIQWKVPAEQTKQTT